MLAARNYTLCLLVLMTLAAVTWAEETNPRADALSPEVWRREHRLIDMHMHIEGMPERFERAIRIMNAAGVGVGIELGSGTVTPGKGGISEFERVRNVSQATCPGRFIHYMILDYNGWNDADWSALAVEQINEGHRLGAGGLKEFKRLGLVVRDGQGKLVRVDDPKLDPVWERCGELNMPISIHVGDPQAFWEPLDETNERWEELRDHPNWWFGDPQKYPPRMELLEALERVIERHPKTTFVCVHFGNNPEDVAWVDRQLDKHPNMMIDLAARIPEIGRRDTDKLREFFVKQQDRIVFGTDFQSWEKLILGSSGDDERPTDHDALVFFQKCYRFLETDDRDWAHMTPIQGNWTISSIKIPA
ncbi:MAG: amidohydrolase family protein [Pirellulales bacterium]